MVSPTLLVLAAGMGSRYGGLKQLDPVGPDDETIMDYSIFDARRAGFGKVVFVIRKETEDAFRKIIGARYEKRVPVEYCFQEVGKLIPGFSIPDGRTKPWGTTHAILMAANAIHEPFAVINADDFYGAGSFKVLAEQLKSGSSDYAMVGFVLRNTLSEFGTVARGVCHVSEDGYLRDISELKSIEREGSVITNIDAEGQETVLNGGEMVSMNMWGFTPQIFGQLHDQFQRFLKRYGLDLSAECYIPSVVNTLIHAGTSRVKVLRSGDAWFGVTYREDHPRVVQSILRLVEGGTYPRKLWR
ncbi:MAG: nucleotidyltransferase [Acidobacteria bacterium]|nr:nucleotidyltransferase [Acidobacteriota bacterium]